MAIWCCKKNHHGLAVKDPCLHQASPVSTPWTTEPQRAVRAGMASVTDTLTWKHNGKKKTEKTQRAHIFWFPLDSIRSNPSRVLVIQIRRGSIADAIRICLSSNRPISKTTPQTCMESLRLHSQRLSTLNSRLSTKYAFSISCWIGCICSSWKWTNSGPNNCVTRDYTSF